MVADVSMNIIILETFNETVNIIDNEGPNKENASPDIELQKCSQVQYYSSPQHF